MHFSDVSTCVSQVPLFRRFKVSIFIQILKKGVIMKGRGGKIEVSFEKSTWFGTKILMTTFSHPYKQLYFTKTK